MKIAVFKYEVSKCKWKKDGGGECVDSELIEREINEFCEDKNVVDIKVNTVDYSYHNNGGCNGVTLVYTIMYK